MADPAHVDPKLARGLTMAEVRAILRHDPASRPGSLRDEGHPVRRAAKPVLYRMRTSRAPDAGYVRALAASIDDIHERDPGTLSREALAIPASSREGFVGFERRYLAMRPEAPDPDCRTLVATCTAVYLSDRHMSLNECQLFEVGLHAIERFHQRTRSGLVRDALRAFAAESLANIGLVWALMDAAEHRAGGSFALPFADGLALASCVDRPILQVETFALVQPRGKRELVYDRDPDTMRRRAAASTSSACRVNTFVGPQEMAPRQVRLRDEVLAISRRHAGCLAHIGDMMLSTGRIIEGMLDLGYEARTDKMWAAMSRDVGRLARDPERVGAMAGPGAAPR